MEGKICNRHCNKKKDYYYTKCIHSYKDSIYFKINLIKSQNSIPNCVQCCARFLSIHKFVVNRSFSGTQAQKATLTAATTTRLRD